MVDENPNIRTLIKYQVFISGTFVDLEEERKEVIETVLKQYNFPVGMELFGAVSKAQWEVITHTIDTSDIYVLIVGHRYGSLTRDKISYTEKEFDYAYQLYKEGKIRVLCFIRDRNVPLEPYKLEEKEALKKKLIKFISKVQNSGLTVQKWRSATDLGKCVALDINKEVDEIKSQDSKAVLNFGWIKFKNSFEQFRALQELNEFKRTLHDVALSYETLNEDIETYTVDIDGGCKIERERVQLCKSDLTCNFTQYISDKESTQSRIEDILDLDTGKSLTHSVYKNEQQNFGFFVLFDRLVKRGEKVRYRCKAYVENYLSNLIERNIGYIKYVPFSKTSFLSKKDVFIFPDIPLFENLVVIVEYRHNKKSVNKELVPEFINHQKVYSVNYEGIKYGNEIVVQFRK